MFTNSNLKLFIYLYF